MEDFYGQWELEKNINFDNFLIYCQYSWLTRQIALKSYINLTLEKGKNELELRRIIKSKFFNSDELYIIDNKFHINDKNLKKKHNFKDNILTTEIIGDISKWNEIINIENKNKLIIKRFWQQDGNEQICEQIFYKI